MQQIAARLSKATGTTTKLPSYKQVRTEVYRLKTEPALIAVREGAKSVARPRESAESFVLSIPAPALLTQVDEHTMDLYVVTPDGTTVASRVHATVLICVKTAAILGAILALGILQGTETKDRANGNEPEPQTIQENERASLTKTVETVKEPAQTSTSPKCRFSRMVVSIDLKRFTDSGVTLVECPDYSRTRSLSPNKGILQFPPHDRRKMQTPVTSKRWSRDGKTDWDVISG